MGHFKSERYQNCRPIHQPHSTAFELPPSDDIHRRRHGQRIPAAAAAATAELPTSDGSEATTAATTPAALAEADPSE